MSMQYANVDDDDLAAIVGRSHVLGGPEQKLSYATDRAPLGLFHKRVGELPGTLPSRIVCPADTDEVSRLVAYAARMGLKLIPYGAGSGVLGGTIPLNEEIVVDLRRLDGIVSLNEVDAVVTVRAGTNGGAFEAALNERGFTCGHLPQSIHISTVGGWVACRGGGQASSRFGKIEDIVLGLKVVLPSGQLLDIRPVPRRSVGPSLLDLFVGSEGTLGVITEVTLRVWRKSRVEKGTVLAFPDCPSAWRAARQILQSELRPTVLRIYDEVESGERTKGVGVFADNPVLAILQFSGIEELARVEEKLSLEIAAECGAVAGPDDLYLDWLGKRFTSLSAAWQERGYYVDTIEVAAPWSAIEAMHDEMLLAVSAICPEAHFGAHWSHAYSDGVCQYMTCRLPPMPHAKAMELHAAVWDRVQTLANAHGGTIAHHHGVGCLRNRWLRGELGIGLDVLQSVKDSLDPTNIMNPGKLGMRA